MSSIIDSIAQSIQDLSNMAGSEIDNPYVMVGTVQSIDGPGLCTVLPQDTNRAIIQNIAFDIATPPPLGSQITVMLYDNGSGYIAKYGGTKTVALNQGTVDYGGMVKIAAIITKLNDLENKVNTILSWIANLSTEFNAHTHIITTPGNPSGPSVPLETKLTEPPLTITIASDLENTTVTHGNGAVDHAVYNAKVTAARAALDAAQLALTNYSNTVGAKSLSVISSAVNDPQLVSLTKIRDDKQRALDALLASPQ